jgi:hypothetical protein
MFRARPSALALTAVGLVVAAIIGVRIGQSAISEINPIHFQGPLERPRAITPPPEPASYNPYGQPYVWSTPPDPPLADCGADCDSAQSNRAMRLALDEAAGRDTALPYWRDATPTTQLRPWAPGTLPDRGPIERYLHYPVDSEQAAQKDADPAPAPEVSGVEALRPPPVAPDPAVEE